MSDLCVFVEQCLGTMYHNEHVSDVHGKSVPFFWYCDAKEVSPYVRPGWFVLMSPTICNHVLLSTLSRHFKMLNACTR